MQKEALVAQGRTIEASLRTEAQANQVEAQKAIRLKESVETHRRSLQAEIDELNHLVAGL